MVGQLVPDALWAEIEPLLPSPEACPKGGHPPISNGTALTGLHSRGEAKHVAARRAVLGQVDDQGGSKYTLTAPETASS
jgi:hypothetical protein